MDLERKSQRASFGKNLTRLFEVEGSVFTKDIHKWQRQARRMSPPPFLEDRQHGFANEIRVALRIVFVFRRDRMGAEKRDHDIEQAFIVEGKQGFKQAQFRRGL